MNKVSFITLWDMYRGLLTPARQEIADLYFNLDLTPSEIADEKGITRQAVSECLKTCEKQLEEYEEKLGFAGRLGEISQGVTLWAEEFRNNHPEFSDEADRLLMILNKEN